MFILFIVLSVSIEGQEVVRFGVCTDLHKDIMPDADQRLEVFVDEMNRINPDFIIQLGDFCFSIEKNKSLIEIWNKFRGKKFHVLGNHDLDFSSKDSTRKFLKMNADYYSFDIRKFHFVVLDLNNFKKNDTIIDYNHGNYYSYPESRGFIDKKQIDWLKDDLSSTGKTTVIFSHQNPGGTRRIRQGANMKILRSVLNNENKAAGYNKVIACFCGHNHADIHWKRKGIHYFQVNSISYNWITEKYQCTERFSREDNKRYPGLRNTAPYKEPLYAFVEISEAGYIKIRGEKSKFIPPTPRDLGVPWRIIPGRVVPYISHRNVKF